MVKNDISPLNPNYIADGTRMRMEGGGLLGNSTTLSPDDPVFLGLSVLFVKWILKDFNGATGEAEFYLNSMKVGAVIVTQVSSHNIELHQLFWIMFEAFL